MAEDDWDEGIRLVNRRHEKDPPMRFRWAFCGISGRFWNLVDGIDASQNFWENVHPKYPENEYMDLMLFVQHFNIPREDFDAVLNTYTEISLKNGWNLTDEFWELPNADIIYTFDNDIIRYYYRRE